MSELRRMSWGRRVYGAIVRLHPAEFRAEFGREMERDFADAVERDGLGRLCRDAVVSVGRQWAGCVAAGGDEAEGMARRSLLAGQYVMIRDRRMSPLELGRGMVASVTLLAVCAWGMRLERVPVVAAASRSEQGQAQGQQQGRNAGVLRSAQNDKSGGANDRSGGRGDSAAAAEDAARRLDFDVASVRHAGTDVASAANVGVGVDDGGSRNGGYLSGTQTLAFYVLFAYKLPKFKFGVIQAQLPVWARTERFTIEARAAGNPTKDQMRLMLQRLLKERFGLVLRTETRTAPAYAMVLTKPGRLGASLRQRSTGERCVHATPEWGGAATAQGGSAGECGWVVGMLAREPGVRRYEAQGVSMGQIAGFASDMADWGQLDRPVVDGTKMRGTFDFSVEFMLPVAPGMRVRRISDKSGVSLRDALAEQLGIGLKPVVAPVDVLVVGPVHEPGED